MARLGAFYNEERERRRAETDSVREEVFSKRVENVRSVLQMAKKGAAEKDFERAYDLVTSLNQSPIKLIKVKLEEDE